ncbi:Nuclease sbcCD subunit D [Candidatus Ornithobacterium hominis]|uniref:Nuclease SbcCD subunit D n=1 Tax=Candidatus Ornithobacterium hominis TaxID=2497989 RepID=A0A383TUU7_9FLAO|nr:exonuclease subunit SbcD [Candidatus Ornithobacterium hominis]MCT7904437.1 exonuclease subunit SbcD [Candidatus Ornithobacterium hominis]SZD71335.1 Nuclease sbcCD subunit D [Candidatus Ornithobacterium hominis]
MKIIHTADWHIGKRLHNFELDEDFQLFIDWLTQIIQQEQVELILIAGDVFDFSNPSSHSRQLFYNTMIRLQQLNCKIIITGGNHDSPAMLNAPKEILNTINISVLGGMPNDEAEAILPVQNQQNKIELVVHAIPFLREVDLRKSTDGISYEDRIKVMQNGIENIYKKSIDLGKRNYPHLPHIAMGHLFTAGVSPSDSEREIQIGNQAKFEAQRLGNGFDYIALGHIHKPQKVNAAVPAYYSGSPLPLSFSERTDEKRILLLDTAKGFEPKSIPVPNFRKLIRLNGCLNEIQEKLKNLEVDSTLPSLLEVILEEKNYDTATEDTFLQIINTFKHPHAKIVKSRMIFENRVLGAHELFAQHEHLNDLKPVEILDKMIASQKELKEEDKNHLRQVFHQLLEEIQSE